MKSTDKPKVAFFDFAGCEGCQLTVIDSLQNHPTLLEAVDIVQFREAMSEKGDDYQIAFVEGSCTRPVDESRLKTIREQAQIVIALGACAHLGGVNALRNWQSQAEVLRYVYGRMAVVQDSYPASPIEAIIPIDGFVPGCPVDREEFVQIVKMLLQGRQLRIPDYPGKACLGPVTRAGCGAICPSNGVGCDGCRGPTSTPNMEGLRIALSAHGINENLFIKQIKLFQSYQLIHDKRDDHGSQ
jgi:sulfhydrogenase subunit delta